MGTQVGSKQKILQSARELFYQIGYQATSVDDILTRSGVAKSNFYYHFKTKDDLAFAVLDVMVAEFTGLKQQTLDNRALSPSERLQVFLDGLCRIQVDIEKMGGCPFGNLAAALPNTEEDARSVRFRTHLSQLFRQIESALGGCLAEGMTCGEFRSDVTPDLMATFLLAVVEGLMMLAKTHKDAGTLQNGFAVAQRLLRVA